MPGLADGTSRIDTTRLAAYLGQHIEGLGAPLTLDPISGGHSNPTFFLAVGGKPARHVLRKQPAGPILPSAHAIDREYRIMKALAETAVPVPRMLHYCDDASVIGTPFYVMERVEGRVFHDPGLPGLSPAERAAVFDAMNDVLARLHSVDFRKLGLEDYGRHGDFFARQIARWSKQHALSRFGDGAEIDRLAEWLGANIPDDDDAVAIIHGDYRLGNLMFHPSRPDVVAVLDWELSTLGHPLSDLGYNLLCWIQKRSEYDGLGDRDIAALGIPAMEDYASRYLARRGLEGPLDPFYIAFAFFRLAVIFEGIVQRAAEGGANGLQDDLTKRLIGAFARHGLAIAGV